MSASVHIRKAGPSDSTGVAALHRRQIPWGSLTQLGEEFVNVFYRALIGSPVGFVYMAERDGRCVGFAAGVVDWRRFYREFVLRHSRLALRALAASLRQVRWRRLVETTRYAASGRLPRAELVSIALEPEARGEGIAGALVRTVLDEFSTRGVRAVRVTAGSENLRANRFYERIGFRLYSRAEIHPGEEAAVYVMSLEPDRGAEAARDAAR